MSHSSQQQLSGVTLHDLQCDTLHWTLSYNVSVRHQAGLLFLGVPHIPTHSMNVLAATYVIGKML